jgi:HK97 family phage major capsid protein
MSDLAKQFEAIESKLDKSLNGQEDAKQKAASFETKLTGVETSVKEVKDNVATVEKSVKETETSLKTEIKVIADEVDKIKADSAKLIGGQEVKAKSFNERLVEAVQDNLDNVEKFIKGGNKKLTLELKAVGAVSTANVTGTTNWGAANDGKFIMNPNNINHIRTLIPTRSYGPATDYYFMRENGAGEGTITTVAEGATKPQIDIDLVEASVKFEWIAGWMLLSRKAMMNIPGLIGFLQSRLPERLLDAEDAQILYGNGTSPNLKGILVSGNNVASTSTISNKLIKKIIDDITLLEGTHKRKANGIVVTPAQFAELLTNVASGSGEYNLPPGVVFNNGQLSIWGVPVQKTTSLAGTDYVVGDFQNGTELLIQEAMNIQFFEQDSTNVRSNQVTVRIEEAVALPVYASNMFVLGTSATS